MMGKIEFAEYIKKHTKNVSEHRLVLNQIQHGAEQLNIKLPISNLFFKKKNQGSPHFHYDIMEIQVLQREKKQRAARDILLADGTMKIQSSIKELQPTPNSLSHR